MTMTATFFIGTSKKHHPQQLGFATPICTREVGESLPPCPSHEHPVKRPRETDGPSPRAPRLMVGFHHSVVRGNEGRNEMDRPLQS